MGIRSNKFKKSIAWVLALAMCFNVNSFAAVVSDNDGSAFITKAEFDSFKNSFQSQINEYQQSIDSKIDGAIASYLAGIQLSSAKNMQSYYENAYSFPLKFWANQTDVERYAEDKYFAGNLMYCWLQYTGVYVANGMMWWLDDGVPWEYGIETTGPGEKIDAFLQSANLKFNCQQPKYGSKYMNTRFRSSLTLSGMIGVVLSQNESDTGHGDSYTLENDLGNMRATKCKYFATSYITSGADWPEINGTNFASAQRMGDAGTQTWIWKKTDAKKINFVISTASNLNLPMKTSDTIARGFWGSWNKTILTKSRAEQFTKDVIMAHSLGDGMDMTIGDQTWVDYSWNYKTMKTVPTFGYDFSKDQATDDTTYSARNVIDNYYDPVAYGLEDTGRDKIKLYEGLILSQKSNSDGDVLLKLTLAETANSGKYKLLFKHNAECSGFKKNFDINDSVDFLVDGVSGKNMELAAGTHTIKINDVKKDDWIIMQVITTDSTDGGTITTIDSLQEYVS